MHHRFSIGVSRTVSFPQGLEGAAALLPRCLLDWLEIHGLPGWIPDSVFRKTLDFWAPRRVAVVRQSAALSGYQPGQARGWEDLVLSAPYHLGPFGFFSDLQADFFVVKQEPDPETYLWREKHRGDPNAAATWEFMENHIRNTEELAGVVSCGDVRWEDYDLVVCFDIPVPARLTHQTRKTLWAYFSIEAGGDLHNNSLWEPVSGYHMYLNHSFRRYRTRPRNRRHLVEFPFSFQSAAGWQALLDRLGCRDHPREGGVVDKFSWLQVPAPSRPELRLTRLSDDGVRWPTRQCVELLAARKFAIRTEPRKRWGNWSIEAVQAGCLFLGRAASVDMKGALLPGLEVENLGQAQRRMAALLEAPERLQRLRQLQAAMVEHLAFRRPLADLTERAGAFFSH